KASGLRWVCPMLLVLIPWARRAWALPFPTALAPPARRPGARAAPHDADRLGAPAAGGGAAAVARPPRRRRRRRHRRRLGVPRRLPFPAQPGRGGHAPAPRRGARRVGPAP